MKTVIASIILFFCITVAKAETVIIPIQDLLFEVPSFNSPKFNLNAVLNGGVPIGEIPKSKREKKEVEKKLIDLAYEIYPDASSIRIWKGNFIIKL